MGNEVATTAVLSFLDFKDLITVLKVNGQWNDDLKKQLFSEVKEDICWLLPKHPLPLRIPVQRDYNEQYPVDMDWITLPFDAPHFVLRIKNDLENVKGKLLVTVLYFQDIWLEADVLHYHSKKTGINKNAIFNNCLKWILSSDLTKRGQAVDGLRFAFLNGYKKEMKDFIKNVTDEKLLKLYHFTLDQSNDLDDEQFQGFAEVAFQKLTHLRIFANLTLTDKALEQSISRYGNHFKEINLSGSTCSTDNIIGYIVRKCSRLEVLDITRGLALTEMSLILLLGASMRKLWYLRSYANQHIPKIAYNNIKRIMGRVKYIDLCGSLIDSHQLKSCLVENNIELLAINLTWCKAINSGAIKALLKGAPSLQWLSLHGLCHVDEVAFADGPFPEITAADLRGTAVKDQAPIKVFPNCKKWILAR